MYAKYWKWRNLLNFGETYGEKMIEHLKCHGGKV